MIMSRRFTYEDVEQYLRTFSTEEPHFDFGGLLHLALAGIENLRKNVIDGDIRAHAHLITDAQASFLQRLLKDRAESIEWFKDHISHSSLTGQL
jgi:hypothetical protein